MHDLLYWGEHLDWIPIAWFGLATAMLLGVRLLTVWFYVRRVRAVVGDDPDENDAATMARTEELFSSKTQVVPLTVSNLYFLSGLAFIAIVFWGLVSTAWWMIILGMLVWVIVHWPFREIMLSWSRVQNVWLYKRDADALLKGDLSSEQEKIIKKRMGL